MTQYKSKHPVIIGMSDDALDRRERLLAARRIKPERDAVREAINPLARLYAHYEQEYNQLHG